MEQIIFGFIFIVATNECIVKNMYVILTTAQPNYTINLPYRQNVKNALKLLYFVICSSSKINWIFLTFIKAIGRNFFHLFFAVLKTFRYVGTYKTRQLVLKHIFQLVFCILQQ